jgi:hypothetical protein
MQDMAPSTRNNPAGNERITLDNELILNNMSIYI